MRRRVCGAIIQSSWARIVNPRNVKLLRVRAPLSITILVTFALPISSINCERKKFDYGVNVSQSQLESESCGDDSMGLVFAN